MLRSFLLGLFISVSFMSAFADNDCTRCKGSGIGESGKYWDKCKHCGGCGYEFSALNPLPYYDWTFNIMGSYFEGVIDPFYNDVPAELSVFFFACDPKASHGDIKSKYPSFTPGVSTINFLTGRDSEVLMVKNTYLPVLFFNITADHLDNLIMSATLDLACLKEYDKPVDVEAVNNLIYMISDYLLAVGRKVLPVMQDDGFLAVYYCEDSPINDLGIRYHKDSNTLSIRHHFLEVQG